MPKGQVLAYFTHFGLLLKNVSNILYFCIELPRKGINELPKDGFARIALNVIFQGRR